MWWFMLWWCYVIVVWNWGLKNNRNSNNFMLKNTENWIILNIIFYLNRKVKLKLYEIEDLKKKLKNN